MDKIRAWWYESNAKKGTPMGFVVLGVGVVAFIGVWIWILTQ